MPSNHIVFIGSGGLLGEILSTELRDYADGTYVPDIVALHRSVSRDPDVIVIWSAVSEFDKIRSKLQQVYPADLDPLIVVPSLTDPATYFTRLHETSAERRRLGFDELVSAIVSRFSGGIPAAGSASGVSLQE